MVLNSGTQKTLLRFVLFVVVFGALLAVTNPVFAQQDGEPVLKLWHAYRGAEQEALDELVEQWNDEHPDARIKSLAVPYEAFSSKLTNAIPRGHGPDVFIAAHERTGDWSKSNLLAEWSEPDAPWGEYHPTTVDAVTYESKRWAIPLAYKSLVLFYNTELVDRPPTTTDELIEVAKSHTDPKAGKYGLVYEAANFYVHASWLFGFGGEIFDERGELMLGSEQVADSYAFAASLVNTEKVVPEDASGTLVSHLFNKELAVFAINGPWFLGELDEGLPYAMAPLPTVSETGKPAKPFLTVEAAFVSSATKHPEHARAFAQFLATPKSAEVRAVKGLQPVATLATYELDSVSKNKQLEVFRRQLDAAVPMPNRPEMNSVWEPANQALRRVLRGAAEPDVALAQAMLRYRVYTRPPPEAKPVEPFVIGVVMFILAIMVYTVFRFRRDNLWPQIKANKPAYLYLAPAFLGMILLVVAPFVVGSAVSLFAHRSGEFTYVGLSNFFDIVTSKDYGLDDPLSFYFTLGVTIAWTAINVFLHVSLGMILALLLREPWLQMRGLYRVLLIIPWAIPNYITALIWKGMFHKQFGAINGILVALGLEPVSWFSQFSTAFAANVATNTWLGFPFMMVVILGALQSIPRDLEEAAMVDGATWWQRFRHVVLPLLRPSLVPAVILGTVWTFNMFNIIYLVSGGEPDGATEILISESYKWAFTRQQQYGYAAAYAVLIFFVLLGYSAATGQLKTDD